MVVVHSYLCFIALLFTFIFLTYMSIILVLEFIEHLKYLFLIIPLISILLANDVENLYQFTNAYFP